jgi:hypothetical protein
MQAIQLVRCPSFHKGRRYAKIKAIKGVRLADFASNNAANVRLNTSIGNLLRNLEGGVVGNAPVTDLCECMAR